LFRVLIRVNGVGPRLGLAILSSLTVSHLVQCIKQNDIKRLTAVPGIGKKTAERLMIEMRDRLQEWDHLMVASPDTSAADKVNPIEADVEAALVNLGYKPQEAALALASIQWSEEEVPLISFEETIKKALNVLSGR
ncbi:MAG: Holliday junction branch migration protein RuvA, partial [Gammaproteobacteria bacterium]|nr:Holliday junction branch migration protein RuvA [Gammaproteobacteria bacterium]